jgi:hypothetical protein
MPAHVRRFFAKNIVSDSHQYTGCSWLNEDEDNPTSLFKASWKVPSSPSSRNNQTILLGYGLRTDGNSDPDTAIGPVLQWGMSPGGGGSYWAVASWYVSGGLMCHTPLIPVKEGDSLDGEIKITNQGDGNYEYTCSFTNIPGTELVASNSQILNLAEPRCDVYQMQYDTDYPGDIKLEDINIRIGINKEPSLSWTVIASAQSDLSTTVTVDGATDGEVDITMSDDDS